MKRLLFLILSLLLVATQAIPAVTKSRKELYVFNESSNCELSDEAPLSMHCTSESSMELSDTDAQCKPIYPQKKILNVKYISQEPNYPCGCEGVSAVMLLDYHGFKISVDEFFENTLDTFPFTYNKRTDSYYGEDMDRYYVGDPTTELGKGCFAPVIKAAVEKVVPDEYIAVVEQGYTVSELVEEYVKKQNKPILLWATSLMRSSYKGTTWHINRTGGTYSFPAYMHCMVLVGYNEAERVYYFNDPYKSRGLVAYDMELVETRFKELGSQALALMHRNDYKAEKTDVSQGMVYAIRNAETGKYVTTINGEIIIQSTFKNDASQLFAIQKNSDGSICFINVKTNTALAASYLDIQLGTWQANIFQSFEISYAGKGFMRISLAKDPSIALTVCGNYNGEGGNANSLSGSVYLSNATESHLLYEYWELVPVEMP